MFAKTLLFFFCIGSLLSIVSCSKGKSALTDNTKDSVPVTTDVPTADYDINQLTYCTLFQTAPVTTVMNRQDYNELSGIAASRINRGILYMHDDNKNSPIIISDTSGNDLGTIVMDGTSTVNPEDISVGPGPDAGKSYIYYADIGDNNNNRTSVAVYRFEEPVLNNPSASTQIHVTNVVKIELKYPSYSYNSETILVDPLTKDIFLATKETNRSTLYKAAYPQSEASVTTMQPVLNMRFFDLLTSGDISSDGTEILLRDKGEIWYWPRDPQKSVVDALLVAPQKAPYAGNEHQGEGVGFAYDGSGYFTNSEIRDYPGAVSNLSFYKRK